ncbi:unnamed protein product (macronuclear) [Paramecium tetraurelia]|uniref:Transmembrane protein n=1 Tax=Paramecium tetraurelia TaxID=5888 RepID=A0BBA0_PARTE|nr:uncharacterized protein GSPATT00000252001 [Paramecium tetraurelia]CAK55817.1 unnamed protein product [Paramecium tetraurelia]|eukprot:XP_001423215.1 hypothetical protein (macronuclear) [Paramecium tetraurelia strain d4-2]
MIQLILLMQLFKKFFGLLYQLLIGLKEYKRIIFKKQVDTYYCFIKKNLLLFFPMNLKVHKTLELLENLQEQLVCKIRNIILQKTRFQSSVNNFCQYFIYSLKQKDNFFMIIFTMLNCLIII